MICTDSKVSEEKGFESSIRQSKRPHSSDRSQHSQYLQEQDIEEIRADCQRKSNEMDRSIGKNRRTHKSNSLAVSQPKHVYLTLQELLEMSMQSDKLSDS